jgi:hypothetical protein
LAVAFNLIIIFPPTPSLQAVSTVDEGGVAGVVLETMR